MARAEQVLDDGPRMARLIARATAKGDRAAAALGSAVGGLRACIRLLRAYSGGHYQSIPWQPMVMVCAALLYFVMPFDAVPDFLVGFDLADDAAVLAWVLHSFGAEVDGSLAWEAGRDGDAEAG